MSGIRKKYLVLLMCLILAGSTALGCGRSEEAATNQAAALLADEAKIDETSILGIVEELASEKYKGRMAGTEGNMLAARYISDRFAEIGLEKPQGLEAYYQYYAQPVIQLKSKPRLDIKDKEGNIIAELDYVENFALRSLSSQTNDIDFEAALYELQDMSELVPGNGDIRGKMLLISTPLRFSIPFFELIDKVHECGAAGAIAEYDVMGPNRISGDLTVTPMLGPWLEKDHSPFINVENDTFDRLVAAAGEGSSVHYQCSFTREDNKKVPNVVGLLPGSDPMLKDEYIIIGAHYDHVGDNMDGTYNPGALDNASGTAVLLEVARVLKESGAAPKKSILFIAFNGEEGGLRGSEYYASHPVYPLDKAVMINLDMVGASAKIPLKIAGAERADQTLKATLYEYAKELGIECEKIISGGSDHLHFAEAGVPAVLLIHDDMINGYHTPNDTVEDVDKVSMEQIAKLVLYYIDKNAY